MRCLFAAVNPTSPMQKHSFIAAVGVCACGLFFAAPSLLAQKTIAHWNFNSGTEGTSFSVRPVDDLSGNAYLMYGYDNVVGPSYSAETASQSGLSCRTNIPQDGYTQDPGINNWSPAEWTIEVSVRFSRLEGWTTVVGRDGSSWPGTAKADFYFQKNGINNHFRLDFAAVDGGRYILEAPFAVTAGTWYHVALVCDGSKVSMHVDGGDGEGYQMVASTSLSGTNNALATSGANWIFGRGWYSGKQVDHVDGFIDDVRFTEGALKPAQFLHSKSAAASAVAAPKFEAARSGDEVSLTWNLPEVGAGHFDLYRHNRETPTGRNRVATLYPPTKLYLDQVPDAAATYWYWLVVTDADGKVTTQGPVVSKPAMVWTP
jgi:hypothetical protein